MIRFRTLVAVAALIALPAAAQFPLPIDNTRYFDAGIDHNVVALPNGQVWAWGGNGGGKLGNGTTINSSVPVRVVAGVSGFTNIVAVAASQANSYAIGSDGTLWAWGDDAHAGSGSRLGLGAAPAPALDSCLDASGAAHACAKTPRKVPIPGTPGAGGATRVVQVGAGWGHAVALLENGTVWAWGDNSNGGQLGQGSFTGGSSVPVQVKGMGGSGTLVNIQRIAVGDFHTLALTASFTVISWGRNDQGQLGVGDTTDRASPVGIGGISFGPFAIRAKGSTSFSISAPAIYGWGANNYGQTGTANAASGPLAAQLTPKLVKQPGGVSNLSNMSLFEAGYTTTFSVSSSGHVYVWGLNQQPDPQLGIVAGTANCGAAQNVKCSRWPVQLGAAYDNAVRIVPGGAHTIIRKADNTLALFGNNASGQLTGTSAGGGTFGTAFTQQQLDPDLQTTPPPLQGAGSSLGAQARPVALSFLTLGVGIDFGPQGLNTPSTPRVVTLENLDTSSMAIGAVSVAPPYAVSSDNCSNQNIPPGQACTFNVTFTPPAHGTFPATLVVGAPDPISIDVTGAGLDPPGPPTNVVATPANASATVQFSPPAFDGGTPVTGYTVVSNPAGGVDNQAGAVGTSHQVTGLTNGTAHTFTVIATNAVGDSVPSAPSSSVTPLVGFTLSVAKNGAGFGNVASSPSGIDCGSSCSFLFAANTVVTLSAVANAGSMFVGWSGSGCTGTGTCQVTLSASRAVAAEFAVGTSRLFNLSTRMQVLTGNDVMIAGFIVGGTAPKTVVVNVAGPSLASSGIANPLGNPTLMLVRSSDGGVLATNDDWQSQPAQSIAAIQASGFQPNHVLEPAIIATLAPGAYTAIVQGLGGGTGVGLVGVFEVDRADVPMINISTRGEVLTGNDVMIAGFVIQGTGSRTVVVNVAGPSLVNSGIGNPLANPTLTLVRSSDSVVIATNDDWQTQTNPADVAAIQATGFQPNNVAEPAIIATLVPGAYTAIVQGAGGTTGVGLVGVFAVP